MTVSSYVGLIRRWWLTFVVAAIVGAGSGWLAARTIPTTHTGEVRMLVGPVNAGFDTLRASSELTRTYAELATSDEILTKGLFEAGLALTPADLDRAVRATADGESRLVTIRVELPSAEEAARAANGIANALAAFTAGGTERPEGELRIVNQAEPTEASPATRTALIILLATLGALIGAVFVVTLFEYLDGTVRDADQLRRVIGGAPLGMISGGMAHSRLRPSRAAHPDDQSAFRVLLSDIVARSSSPVRSMLVVSAAGRQDARHVATGLGAAALSIGESAVVLSAETGEAVLGPPLTTRGAGPVGEMQPDTEPEADAAVPERTPTPSVLGATRERADSARIAASVLAEHDLLIVDAGASRDSFSASIWAGETDVALVVAAMGTVQRDDLVEVLDRLDSSGARTIWVVGSAHAVREPSANGPVEHLSRSPDAAQGLRQNARRFSGLRLRARARATRRRLFEPRAE